MKSLRGFVILCRELLSLSNPSCTARKENVQWDFQGRVLSLDLGDRCSSIALLQGDETEVAEVGNSLCVLLLPLRAGLSSPSPLPTPVLGPGASSPGICLNSGSCCLLGLCLVREAVENHFKSLL